MIDVKIDNIAIYMDFFGRRHHPKISNLKHSIADCLLAHQVEILNKIKEHEYKYSILRVLNSYTHNMVFKDINNFLNGNNRDHKIKEIVDVLNSIIWELNREYVKLHSFACSKIYLFRGISNVPNLPIFKGSIINSYRHKFQSFSYNYDVAVGFSTSNIVLCLIANLSYDVVLPINNLKLDGNKLSSSYDEEYEFLLPLNTSLEIIDNPVIFENKLLVPCVIYRQEYIPEHRYFNIDELADHYELPIHEYIYN
jgi:hypothetical protein